MYMYVNEIKKYGFLKRSNLFLSLFLSFLL